MYISSQLQFFCSFKFLIVEHLVSQQVKRSQLACATCSKDHADRIALISDVEGFRTMNSVSGFQRNARYAAGAISALAVDSEACKSKSSEGS